MTDAPRVTIAGGGLAGLTAALRLAERGYGVKLYEQKSILGGNIASRPGAGGVELDVYPHMYVGWYRNFWRLLEQVNDVDRKQLFTPMSTVKQLRRGEFPKFTGPNDMYSFTHTFQNIFSGVGPVPDMIVFGYSNVDLLAERLNPTMLPDDVTVGGFLNARPYMTDAAAAAFDTFMTNVWAIPTSLVSAADYRDYLAYCLSSPSPAFWLSRGPSQRQLIGPLVAVLERRGVEIVRDVQLTGVSCEDGRVREISLQRTRFDPATYEWVAARGRWSEEVDELILAVPAPALSQLVRSGDRGCAIVDSVPRIAELSRFRAQSIPIVHLFFKRKLDQLPAAPVGLYDSRLAIAFTDISQTWDETPAFAGRTVLAVSSSDPFGLPRTAPEDDAFAILGELSEYLGFDPGTAWGESPDIDWELTSYDPNADAQLFLNETGTDIWRPAAACAELENLTFAGDLCKNRIGMATIEAAVTTGLEAAAAIVERRGVGAPVEILTPRSVPGAVWVWMRYAWGPYAMAAKAWSDSTALVKQAGRLTRHLLGVE